MSRFISLSSTSRIFAIALLLCPCFPWPDIGRSRGIDSRRLCPCLPWSDVGGHQVAYLPQQLLAAIRPLLEDPFHIAVEALMVVEGEVLCRKHYNWDRPPGVVLTQRLEEGEAIHLRHHEVQENEIRPVRHHTLQGHTPVFGLGHCPPLLLQHAPQHVTHRRVIFDHQHRTGRGCTTVFL